MDDRPNLTNTAGFSNFSDLAGRAGLNCTKFAFLFARAEWTKQQKVVNLRLIR